jgi:hypothetical protein
MEDNGFLSRIANPEQETKKGNLDAEGLGASNTSQHQRFHPDYHTTQRLSCCESSFHVVCSQLSSKMHKFLTKGKGRSTASTGFHPWVCLVPTKSSVLVLPVLADRAILRIFQSKGDKVDYIYFDHHKKYGEG